MKNFLKSVSILLLLLSSPILTSQELSDYAPKTPEAMAMDKFVDIPPGSYTGVAGYSIPLYNITVDGYTIPVTINYNGMGIKVNEVASSVGLGWALSVGGISLSRQVVGENDLTTNPQDIDVGQFDPSFANTAYYNLAVEFAGINSPNQALVSELQPDYFSYSLLHNSGKFILDNIGQGQTIPKDDIMFKSSIGTVLLDNQGIEYRFVMQTESFSISGSNGAISPNRIPSYSIEQIIFPSGKTINFEYTTSNHNYIANHSETKRRLMTDPAYANGSCSAIEENISRNTYIMSEKLLSKIVYDNAEINFVYDTQERLDIGGKKLKDITVVSKIGNATKIIKDYSLSTSYWDSGSIPYTDIFISPSNEFYDGLVKRLRLDGVEETLSQKLYTFDYYDRFNLPYRLSKKTDFWGLYNGQDNPSYIHQYTYIDNNGDKRVEEGADKNPVLGYAKTASLKTVHLPTGGTQEFEYELDDYKFDDTENQFFKIVKHVSITPSTVFNQPISLNLGPDYWNGFDYNLEFFWSNNNLPAGNNLPLNNTPYYSVELTHGNNIEVQKLYHNIKVDLDPLSQNNNYFLTFKRSGNPVEGELWAKLTWYQNNPQYVANKKAGNLRVSSITLRDSDNSIALKRNYAYTHPTDTIFSSGIFRDFRKSYVTQGPAGDLSSPGSCTYRNYSNNYDVNTSTFKGKSVIYEYVKEEYVNTNNVSENYFTLKQFKPPTFFDQLQPNNLPNLPFVDDSYTGGLLLNSKAKNSNGDVVSETTNIYEFDNHFNADSYNNQFGVASNALSGGIVVQQQRDFFNHYDFNWNPYYIPSTWVKLLESTTKNYFENGSDIETKTTYEYESNYLHIKPISETVISPSGETLINVYQYPQELITEPYATDLIAANRIASPLITSTYKNTIGVSQELSKQRTVFENWSNGLFLPETIQTLKGIETYSNTLEDRIKFHKYDDYGNPMELSKASGVRTMYVWGYNNTKPIAKIVGHSYTNISSNLLTAINDSRSASNNDSSVALENFLKTKLEAIRNHIDLENAQITTYTYDPLIGVTSVTDPKGYMIYYEYDDSNRLVHVKDKNGNILSKNEYNYAN